MERDNSQHHQKTEKSLNRSQSYPAMPPDLGTEMIGDLNENSGRDQSLKEGSDDD